MGLRDFPSLEQWAMLVFLNWATWSLQEKVNQALVCQNMDMFYKLVSRNQTAFHFPDSQSICIYPNFPEFFIMQYEHWLSDKGLTSYISINLYNFIQAPECKQSKTLVLTTDSAYMIKFSPFP